MTDEEINRKFDVVAGHLASLAVGLQGLQETVQSLQGTVGGLAQAQLRAEERWSRTEASVRSLLAITEIQSREIRELAESIKAVDERGKQTDERLNALINTVERIISERRNGDKGKE